MVGSAFSYLCGLLMIATKVPCLIIIFYCFPGVYEVGFKNFSTSNSFAMILMVMENLTYQRNVVGSYDLKGKTFTDLSHSYM